MNEFNQNSRVGVAPLRRAPYHDSSGHQQDITRPDNGSESLGSGATANASSEDAPALMTADGVARRPPSGKFKVNAQTGGVSCSIPIPTSSGRSGFGPELSLQYGSGSAGTNSVFGMGWSLDGADYITRKTVLSIPKYEDDVDTFVHSGLGDLVPGEQTDVFMDGYRVRKYRARVEAEPMLIQRWTKDAETFWKTISSSNVTTVYGLGDGAQVFHRKTPETPKRIFSWLTCEMYDGHGNHLKYSYKAEDAEGIQHALDVFEAHRTEPSPQRYLKSIKYGNATPSRDAKQWDLVALPSTWLFEVVFDYGEHRDEGPITQEDQPWALRPDPFSSYNSGFEIRTYRRCRRVLMFHHFQEELGRLDYLVSSTNFDYEIEAHSGTTLLRSSTHNGHSLKDGGEYWTLSLPPVEFSYSTAPVLGELPVEEMDLGMSGITSSAAQWIDLDGEGAPGVLIKAPGGGWYYQRNLTHDSHPQVGEPRLVTATPNVTDSTKWDFEDIRLDGLPDVVVAADDGCLRGFYEREEDGGWLNFVPFETYPNIKESDSIRRVDLNGDGHADLLCMAPAAGGELTWHESQGPRGFGAGQRTVGAPSLSLQDPRSTIQLCDMTGDGLADIVQIGNGSICYWPNMGHGNFGAKVAMGNSPWMAPDDLFLPQRLRTADITGSGTTDLIYLQPKGGAVAYYNRSGNTWSDGHVMPSFPPLDRVSAVDVLDIRGQGTPCLCWTSDLPGNADSGGLATVRFIDLMRSQRPGLLTKWSNGTGSETTFTFKSAFSFYRQDQVKGTPWSTKLPFSIQCVAKAVTVDHISQLSHTTRYAYHNGHYDHAEKQFRGFQLVDIWDAEELTSAVLQFQRPPVLNRSWFYTGLRQLDEPNSLPQSYRIDAPRHDNLPSTTIPSNLSVTATTEAYRALAGRERRTEVFSVDSSDHKSVLPYLVTQRTYEAVMPQNFGTRMVTRVNEREDITAHYERVMRAGSVQPELSHDEARVQHRLVLQTDKYGNILLEALVVYGKSSSELSSPEDQRKQEESVVTYTETSYTNALESDSHFQVPLTSEVQQYRFFSLSSSRPAKGRYTWNSLGQEDGALFKGATEIPIEGDVPEQVEQKDPKGYRILLSKTRTLYSRGDLREPLPLGSLEKYSIVHQSYQLAFTSTLLDAVLKNARPAIDLQALIKELDRGGYQELSKGSGEWWTASNRQIFGDDSPERRLKAARSQFYVPNGQIDVFGNISTKELDAYCMLVIASTNAVQSKTTFENDYARLQPSLVTDANMNRTQTAFDPLGRPIGVAVLGKADDTIANSLDKFQSEIDEEALEAFFHDPAGSAASLLSKASHRTIYHLNRYHRDSMSNATSLEPGWIAELTRHDHLEAKSTTPAQISVQLQYLNGAGAVIQIARLSGGPDDLGKLMWDFSGWVVNDNKGQPVQKFQPSRAPSHVFRRHSDSHSVLATTLLRDPLDRVVALLNADHTWSKTRFTPWTQVDFNAGNTAMIDDPAKDDDVGQYFQRLCRSLYFPTWHSKRIASSASSEEKQAAYQAELYADAPTTVYLDAFGRTIVRRAGKGKEMRVSHTDYNVRGQVSAVRDTLDRVVDTLLYDLLGRPLFKNNMESGQRWSLPDSLGSPLLSWSDRGTRKRATYDALRRVVEVWLLSEKDLDREIQIIKKIYGEGVSDAVANNLNGQLYQCYDQAGLRTHSSFDVQGRCTKSTLNYAAEFRETLNWSSQGTQPMLEAKTYASQAVFNALGMVVKSMDPELGRVQRNYDPAGRLRAIQSFDTGEKEIVTSSVNNIEYEPDDRIAQVLYGNGSSTSHSYDPQTRHLMATQSLRLSDKEVLQDLSYTYDTLGKVVQTTDKARTPFIPINTTPATQQFRYDHFGQLVSATGRVQTDPASKQLRPYDFNSDVSDAAPGGKVIRYTEMYAYDLVGNLQTMQHVPEGEYSGWTRRYYYEEPSCVRLDQTSNRLTRTEINGMAQEYRYDGDAGRHGCMTSIPGYSSLGWDHNDRLHSFSTQRVSEGMTPETTWYIYNAEGNRVRKVTERSSDASSTPTRSKDTRYLPLGDIFTRFRSDGVTDSRTTTTLHVSDAALGRAPASVVETSSDAPEPLTRYRLSEQLDLDVDAKAVSYQEFSPFGARTYRAAKTDAPRAYRFASCRWDSESGLYFCEARYYVCWLGRWISADPLGTVDGLNLYTYVGNDPVNFDDPGGTTKGKKKKPPQPPPQQHIAAPPPQQPTQPAPKASVPPPVQPNPGPPQASQAAPAQATGAPKGVWSKPPKLPVSVNPAPLPPNPAPAPKPLPVPVTVLYRVTDEARGNRFVKGSDVGAVTTSHTGDFNSQRGTASYWNTTREAALFHEKYVQGGAALVTVEVPTQVLQDPNNVVYNDIPGKDWQFRVIADRMGWNAAKIGTEFYADDAQRILDSRVAEVTIGPESMTATAEYKALAGRLEIDDMNPLELKGRFQTQVAFSGRALATLGTYKKTYEQL